jgi:hypothetical protein
MLTARQRFLLAWTALAAFYPVALIGFGGHCA